MIGRALLRLPVRARLFQPTIHHGQPDLAVHLPALLSLRTYATPGRPKTVVGEPSRPVKRAVKTAAAKSATKTAAAKKAAAKKAAAKKKAQTKKTKPKKVETPEQLAVKKEKADAKKAKAAIRAVKQKHAALREAALEDLKAPDGRASTAYTVFISEKMKNISVPSGLGQQEVRAITVNSMRENAAQWKELKAADIEHYNHLANEKRQASQAEYKRQVESYTAEQIRKANNARVQLRRNAKAGTSTRKESKWPAIHDERAVKLPVRAYIQVSKSRLASGDFNNIAFEERGKLVAQEWKVLNETEKRKYTNLERQDVNRYVSEHKDVYGHTPPFMNGNGRQQAVAAAA